MWSSSDNEDYDETFKLQPTYCTSILLYDLPLIPGTAQWITLEKNVYALLLYPYYLVLTLCSFVIVVTSTAMISAPCCHAFWCCSWWFFLALVTLFMWGGAREAMIAQWNLIWPFWFYIGIVLLVLVASACLSLLAMYLMGGRSCAAISYGKKFRNLYLSEKYNPGFAQDFVVDDTQMEKTRKAEREFVKSLPSEGAFWRREKAGLEVLAFGVKFEVLLSMMITTAKYAVLNKLLILIVVRKMITASGMGGKGISSTPLLDAMNETAMERTMEGYVDYQRSMLNATLSQAMPMLDATREAMSLVWDGLR